MKVKMTVTKIKSTNVKANGCLDKEFFLQRYRMLYSNDLNVPKHAQLSVFCKRYYKLGVKRGGTDPHVLINPDNWSFKYFTVVDKYLQHPKLRIF
jgi:hypothetical protein